MEGKRVPIRAYFPSRSVVTIKVNLSVRVSDLRKLMHLESCCFIYQGQIMCERRPLHTYNIKEDEVIVVISDAQQSPELDKWLSVTSEADCFQDRIRFMVNDTTARETAKLRDMVMTKIERKPRSFRRLCNAVQALPKRQFYNRDIPLNLDYETPDAPSCAPVPVNWDGSANPSTDVGVAASEDALVSEKVPPVPVTPVIKPSL